MKKFLFTLFLLTFLVYCKGQSSVIYGLAAYGGKYSYGTLFKYNVNSKTPSCIFNFNNTNGSSPDCVGLCLSNNGLLYGMTQLGGSGSEGVFFSYDTLWGIDSVLVNFATYNGSSPNGENAIIQGSDGYLYGTVDGGGYWGNGVLFRFDQGKKTDTILYSFGYNPNGCVMQAANGLLYGLEYSGGTHGYGDIFSYDLKTKTETTLYSINGTTEGAYPNGSLIQASNGLLYGMTTQEGLSPNYGTLFSFDITTKTYTVLVNFDSVNGMFPTGSLIQASNGLLYGLAGRGGKYNRGVIFSYDILKNKDSVIHSFSGTDGTAPLGTLAQDPVSGLLFGVTNTTFFSIDPTTNSFTLLFTFGGTLGANLGGGKLLIVPGTIITNTPNLTATEQQPSIYPNPAKSYVRIPFNSIGKYVIELYDIYGNKIKQVPYYGQNCELSLVGLSPGMYFAKEFTENMEYISTSKIIVQY